MKLPSRFPNSASSSSTHIAPSVSRADPLATSTPFHEADLPESQPGPSTTQERRSLESSKESEILAGIDVAGLVAAMTAQRQERVSGLSF